MDSWSSDPAIKLRFKLAEYFFEEFTRTAKQTDSYKFHDNRKPLRKQRIALIVNLGMMIPIVVRYGLESVSTL